jgi:hypothetical protein
LVGIFVVFCIKGAMTKESFTFSVLSFWFMFLVEHYTDNWNMIRFSSCLIPCHLLNH